MDSSWSETGDRYMLKLFRDYVFHQVDDSGVPFVDMAHITQCLNKVGHQGEPSPTEDCAQLIIKHMKLANEKSML